MAIAEIIAHVPVAPSPGEEVLLYLNGDFRYDDWGLEYRSGGSRWEMMPKSEMEIAANAVIVRIPPTFNGNSMTVTFIINLNSTPIYSPDYTFNVALPKDKIQYNQNGTIRNMEAKYNHNGVIRDVECWYNHNGVLKKIQ